LPIVNGTYANWTLNLTNGANGTSVATHFVTMVPRLAPWAVVLFIVGIYFVILYALRNDGSRYKFITVTFVPFFISLIFGVIGWVTAGIVATTFSIFVITVLFVIMTTG
jgi:hypothetical protein